MSFFESNRNIKLVAALTALAAALLLTMGAGPQDPADVASKAKKVSADSKEIVITNPSDESEYGLGEYVVEGVVTPESKVQVVVDGKSAKEVIASKEGDYSATIEIKKPGEHQIALAYKGKDGQPVNVKLPFKAKDKKMAGDVDGSEKEGDKPEPNNPKYPDNLMPDDTQDDVVYTSDKENPDADAEAKPVPNPMVDSKPPAKKPSGGKPAGPVKTAFGISTHSNFNVIPRGAFTIGGKGTPGDKIMLLIDGKPSMKGTVKPNGRWAFPVKVNKPGGRTFFAQNLKTRKIAKVRLKIK
jgi:hypothetical protein